MNGNSLVIQSEEKLSQNHERDPVNDTSAAKKLKKRRKKSYKENSRYNAADTEAKISTIGW